MRTVGTLVMLLLTTDPAVAGAKPIPVSEVLKHGIAGRLGLTLGTIVTIEGKVVANRSRSKAAADAPALLRIDKVDGKRLKTPVSHRYKTAQRGTKVSAPKVGQRFRYIGFETGAFRGSPEGEFKYVPAYTTTGFHFETMFLVLATKK